jgi:hypothetical protein
VFLTALPPMSVTRVEKAALSFLREHAPAAPRGRAVQLA